MTCEDLTFLADALLSLCEREPERPFYSEQRFTQKLRTAEARDPLYANCLLTRGEDPLLKRECRAVFREAQLTSRQADVLTKRLGGWTFEEIGRRAGHSKQGAQNIFIQALRKLTKAFRSYPFTGLSDVYWRETHRGAGRGASGKISANVLR